MGENQIIHDGWNHKDIIKGGYSHKAVWHDGEIVWAKDFFAFKTYDSTVSDTGEIVNPGVVTLPFNDTHVLIDWGDGTYTQKGNSGYSSHVYPTSNLTEYTVKIYGKITVFSPGSLSSVNPVKTSSSITEILTPLQRSMRTTQYEYDEPRFSIMFAYCPTLRKIPANLFENFKGVTGIQANGMFEYSGLEELPAGLFDGITDMNINGMFAYCNNLTTIPNGAFLGFTTKYTNGSMPIHHCEKLVSVYDYPVNIGAYFEGCNNLEIVGCSFVGVTSFYEAFAELPKLKTVTQNVFSQCKNATTFYRCFYKCKSLENIPSGLFDGLESVTTYEQCFVGCSSLKRLPSGLFNSAFSCTTFQNCFGGCASLEYIPEGLFDNCYEVTTYSSTFYNCVSIKSVPLDLFDDSQKVLYFGSTFYDCSGITSAVPDLWNRSGVYGGDCYYNCINAANYDSIPDNWKD